MCIHFACNSFINQLLMSLATIIGSFFAGLQKKYPFNTIHLLQNDSIIIELYSGYITFLLLQITWLNICFISSKWMLRGTLNTISHLRSGSVFNVLIGVLAITLFGIIVLLLSKLLITVYLMLISSIVHLIFNFHKNSTKSPNFTFLLVKIKTQATRFQIVVSIANQILKDIHHIIIAVLNQIISKVANILNIIKRINNIDQTNFEFFFAYSSAIKDSHSIFLFTLFTMYLMAM